MGLHLGPDKHHASLFSGEVGGDQASGLGHDEPLNQGEGSGRRETSSRMNTHLVSGGANGPSQSSRPQGQRKGAWLEGILASFPRFSDKA